MLPSSKVASLDRVLSITCANIVIDILCLDHLYQEDYHHHHHHHCHHNLHKLPDHILAHLTGDFLDLLVDLRVVLVLQQQCIWYLFISYCKFCNLYFAYC